MPARAWTAGPARVTSSPLKTMRPVVGKVSPARQLKKVDLPAPFGPISPMISCSSTARSAPDTARKLPNAFDTFLASSSIGAPPPLRHDAVPQLEQSAGFEACDHDDDAAVENVGQTGAAAAEPGVGGDLKRDQDQRADERAEQHAGATERRDDHHLHRDQNAEAGIRIDEAGLGGIERARDRGEGGAERQGLHLGLPHRHPERARGAFARLDGAQIETKAAALDEGG